MDIAALSMAMSQSKVMQQAAVATMKNAMEVAETQMQNMVDMLQQASPPSFGHQLDVRA